MKLLVFSSLVVISIVSFAQTPAKSLPDRLATLRANYERAIERVTGPVNTQFRDELQRLRLEYTKAGNLEAALAVDEELKARFPAVPPVSKNASSPTNTDLARVNVGTSVIAKLVKGEKVCTESEYLWTNIPEAYAGIKFAQPKHKHAATTTFTVKNDGLAYVAFSAKTADEDDNKNDDIISRRDIERMGWKAVDEKFNLLSDDGAYIVFAKQCTAGESFALKTHKYCAPIVLIK